MKRQNIYRDYWDGLFYGKLRMRKAKKLFRRLAKRRMRRENKREADDESKRLVNEGAAP